MPENVVQNDITQLSYTLDGSVVSVDISRKLSDKFYFKADTRTKSLLDASEDINAFLEDPKDMFEYGEYDTSSNDKITFYLFRRYIDAIPDPKFDQLVSKTAVKAVADENNKLNLVIEDLPAAAPVLEAEYIPPLPETVAATQPPEPVEPVAPTEPETP